MGVKLNRAELAKHMGVSVVTIDSWRNDGMPVDVRGDRGVAWQFDLAEVIKWRVECAKKDAAAVAPDGLEEIERRTALAKMHEAELSLAKKRGEVASIADFERAQARVFAQIRANVMNVPQRVVLQLVGETNETTFKQKLKAELALALTAAADPDADVPDDDGITLDDPDE
jgi:phage terminase Nu1 subunit (DNA packaging protein)